MLLFLLENLKITGVVWDEFEKKNNRELQIKKCFKKT